jgi:hypothetical protein
VIDCAFVGQGWNDTTTLHPTPIASLPENNYVLEKRILVCHISHMRWVQPMKKPKWYENIYIYLF